MIYFDNAATSLVKPKIVKDAVYKALNFYTANPGRSGHDLSVKVAEKIYSTKESVKNFFGAKDYSLIFTKNCSEALNLAILGSLESGDHVITTCYEHNSVLRPLESLKEKGVDISILNCDMSNLKNEIEKNITPKTKLVITTMVSNVTGEVCDVFSIGKLCKEKNIFYLVDGAQACGHMQINLEKLNIDMFTFAGHKGLMSITGVGGLLVKNLKNIKPIIYGGTGTNSETLIQPSLIEEDFEVGTLPTIPIFSLGAGIEYLIKNLKNIIKKEQNLSKYLYFELKKLKFLKIYSKETSQNVFSFNVKNLDSVEVGNLLNEKFGIAIRSGLHCAPLIHEKLDTLDSGAIRVSLDFNNTKQEIDYLIRALKIIYSSTSQEFYN